MRGNSLLGTPSTVRVEPFDFAVRGELFDFVVHPFVPSVAKRSRGMNSYAQDRLHT